MLADTQPRYEAAAVETVNQYGLLYTWRGTREAVKPLLFMAHSDVGRITCLSNDLA